MLRFLRTREWVIGRRAVLITIVLLLTYSSYGDAVVAWLRGPSPERDIVITRYEFRPEIPDARPAWIIGFRNDSTRYTYDQIELEASYLDDAGKIIETDKLVVDQKLLPGREHVVGSVDFKKRSGATRGTLKVLGAKEVH